MHYFNIEQKYSRKEIRKLLGYSEPEKIGGIWSTGYVRHEDEFFIFTNILSAGRTGHDYNNSIEGNILYWYAKKNTTFNSPTIQKMVSGEFPVHIFIRENSNDPEFEYKGLGVMVDYNDKETTEITWKMIPSMDQATVKEQTLKRKKFLEGRKINRYVNIYERDPRARKACLGHYGYRCVVCKFNFEETYGEIGKEFIHVHHEKELSMLDEFYEIDPIEDMKPVCPNCHAMIHRKRPAYTIDELRERLNPISLLTE